MPIGSTPLSSMVSRLTARKQGSVVKASSICWSVRDMAN